MRRIKIINEDLFDMAEDHLINVIGFKPVNYRLTEKGNEFYKDFAIWGRSLCLTRPYVEEIFAIWLKRRELKGGENG